jgi:hypothetical protein
MNTIDWKEVSRVNPLFNTPNNKSTLTVADLWQLKPEQIALIGEALEKEVGQFQTSMFSSSRSTADNEARFKLSVLKEIHDTLVAEREAAKYKKAASTELAQLLEIQQQQELASLMSNPEKLKERIDQLQNSASAQ